MTLLFADAETLPTQDPDIIAELAKGITPPANYTKPETIEKWMAENREARLAELVKKTSFDPILGSIACLCWAFDDGTVQATDPLDDEATVLAKFFEAIENATQTEADLMGHAELTVIGHNIANFDLPYIRQRAVILGIRPPGLLLRAMNAKPWDREIGDTMLMWTGDRHKYVSMDALCRAFGFPGKGDFNGSMVADTWPVDPWKVIEYCKGDVEKVRRIFHRITFNSFQTAQAA